MKQFLVVSYDIPNDRRRTKVMKVLEGFGEHVQYSVFECRLEEKHVSDLRQRLKKMATKQDSIRLYFISHDDVSRIEVLGFGGVIGERIFIIH